MMLVCAASGGNAASGAGGMQMDPKMMEQMQKHLSDPATAQMLTSFVQAMKPEDLSALLKQSGMDLSPQQVIHGLYPGRSLD